ncbi:MAG TPA: AAA family ATPase, partial [Abditibacterium sp.]
MEGLSPIDVASLDPRKSYFLAADLTEYFGGTTFAGAKRIVISQLKYSTRQPDALWTWGELRKTREKGASVIRRLAQSYQDLFTRDAISGKTRDELRDDILEKTTIRLVSNQSADPKVLAALKSAHTALKGIFAAVPVAWPDLLKHLKTTQGWKKAHTTTLEKLSESSELGDEFGDFLRVLDLSGCGEVSRLEQKAALLRSVGESVSFDAMEGLRRVCDLLREETQPEREKSLGVTQAHLLATLGVFSYDSLFPCPPQIESTRRYVPTGDAPALAQTLLASPKRCLLAHGEAGVGKTTTMQDLQAQLPAGSVALVYDCYGGGNYHDLHAQRHTYDRALPQLSNQLAALCGLPFLVKVANNAADALRDFKNRLAAASKIVAGSGGVLVIVIDAADNSVTAARTKGDDCFVPHLWNLWSDLPANCFLVMSARTHRQSDLQAPPGTTPYELTGFSAPSSALYLHHVFPGASERSCGEFHQRTSHNPRVQSYLMDRAQELGAGVAAWFYTVRHARLTPGEIFDDLLRAAVQDVREPERAEGHLATLTCLMRPIPMSVFAGACGTSEQEAINFCHALSPGVLLGESGLSFRDEDFETHLRLRVGDLTASHARLGAHFLTLAQSDTYAAQTVADHLFAGECEGETIGLALDGPQPDVLTDDLLRLRVVRRRLELGLKSAARGRRDADAVRLLLRTAEVARTNSAVVQLVQEDPELATLFGNPRSVIELCARKEHVEWFGPAHMQIAALYARDSKTHGLAHEHLEQAKAWLRRYF